MWAWLGQFLLEYKSLNLLYIEMILKTRSLLKIESASVCTKKKKKTCPT